MSSTVQKVGLMLQTLARASRPVALHEISNALGMPKPTARRLLLQLIEAGLVEQSPTDRNYRLGIELITLASAVLEGVEVRRFGTDILYGVMEDTGESAYLTVLDGAHTVYVDSVECDRSIRVLTKVGSRRPAGITASGRVLLAFAPAEERRRRITETLTMAATAPSLGPIQLSQILDRVRENGFAASSDEAEPGVTGVAAPVFNEDKCVAALAIGMPTYRYTASSQDIVHQKVIEGAKKLTERLKTREAPITPPSRWKGSS